MVYRPKIDQELCFVLMPFEQPFLDYYAAIISPAVGAAGLKCKKADEIYGTKAIISDIWDAIWSARAVLADVTGRNPNVNYELGICHTLGVPTVLLTQSIQGRTVGSIPDTALPRQFARELEHHLLAGVIKFRCGARLQSSDHRHAESRIARETGMRRPFVAAAPF